nr:glycosyltransferase [Pyrinomonadaceae bacterium]
MLVSVIIPTFNEARFIGQTLDAVARMRGVVEVIVVDGGSVDETVAVVGGRRDVMLINAVRGSCSQMHAGAGVAQGKVLWFLHADTIPQPDAFELIGESL